MLSASGCPPCHAALSCQQRGKVYWMGILVNNGEPFFAHGLHLFDFSPLCVLNVSSNSMPVEKQSLLDFVHNNFLHCTMAKPCPITKLSHINVWILHEIDSIEYIQFKLVSWKFNLKDNSTKSKSSWLKAIDYSIQIKML